MHEVWGPEGLESDAIQADILNALEEPNSTDLSVYDRTMESTVRLRHGMQTVIAGPSKEGDESKQKGPGD
jgi:hypothetical protein